MAGTTETLKLAEIEFIIDSGASYHIVTNEDFLEDNIELEPPMNINISTSKFIEL